MRQRPYNQLDVFTDTPYLGNPLAVVLDGEGLSDAQMQDFARWTNLSETTFLLPPTQPGADYRVRIFTPGSELPFAGHPTLGSCHAWLAAGGVPRNEGRIVQECAQGLVDLRREGERLAFAAPASTRTAPSPAVLAQVAAALGLKADQILAAQILNNGPAWLTLLLDNARSVLGIEPDHAVLTRLGHKVGVVGSWAGLCDAPCEPDGRRVDFEVRAFAAAIGIPEDPVTGSMNASIAQWLMDEGLAPARYLAAQGTRMRRAGRVAVLRDDKQRHWIGGASVICIRGTVNL